MNGNFTEENMRTVAELGYSIERERAMRSGQRMAFAASRRLAARSVDNT
jgi:hypothetical protein